MSGLSGMRPKGRICTIFAVAANHLAPSTSKTPCTADIHVVVAIRVDQDADESRRICRRPKCSHAPTYVQTKNHLIGRESFPMLKEGTPYHPLQAKTTRKHQQSYQIVADAFQTLGKRCENVGKNCRVSLALLMWSQKERRKRRNRYDK